MNVSAVIVTRGDVDLAPIVESLPFDDVVVWDNSLGHDLKVYGRYAGIERAAGDVIFVQDDDVILPEGSIDELVAAYESGHVVCNMPARFRHDFYEQHALVGFGAIFDRDLPDRSFARFMDAHNPMWPWPWNAEYVREIAQIGVDAPFLATCDIVFTALTPRILVDVDYEDREFASAPHRMWKQPGHVGERKRMLELARTVPATAQEGAVT